MDDKVKKLYDNLTSDGYKLGTINDFTKGLSDPVKSQKFYQNMTADGYKLGNNFDEFSNNVGLKKKGTSESPSPVSGGTQSGGGETSIGDPLDYLKGVAAKNQNSPEVTARIHSDLEAQKPVKTSYLMGAVKTFDESLADNFRLVGGVADKVLGLIPGYDVMKSAGVVKNPFNDVADVIKKSAESNAPLPDNFAGNLVGSASAMIPDLIGMAVSPEIKTSKMIADLGMKTFPKIAEYLAAKEGTEEALKGGTPTEQIINPITGVVKGFASGMAMEGIGKATEPLATSIATKLFPASKIGYKATQTAVKTIGDAIGFGGLGAAQEFMETGKVTAKNVASNAGMGAAFGLVGGMFGKGLDNVVAKSTDDIQHIVDNPKSAKEMQGESDKLTDETQKKADKLDPRQFQPKTIQPDPESENRILQNQQRLGLPAKPEVFTSPESRATFDKINSGKPVLNDELESTSKELYGEYKKLTGLKSATNRQFTIPQIEQAQKEIGDKIDLLENAKNKQSETGDFFNKPTHDEVNQDLMSASVIHNAAVTKATVEDMVEKPQDYIDAVQKSELPDDKKQEVIDKINEVVAANDPKAKEAKPVIDKMNGLLKQIMNNDNNKALSDVEKDIKNKPIQAQVEELKKQVEDIYNKPAEPKAEEPTLGKSPIVEEPVYLADQKDAPKNIKEVSDKGKRPTPEIEQQIGKKLIGTDPKTGLKIYEVDGEVVRGKVFPDFSMGGNSMAYPNFIPEGEVWIDKDYTGEGARETTIAHEVKEYEEMKSGKPYSAEDGAHQEALKEENKVRDGEIAPVEIVPEKGKDEGINEGTNDGKKGNKEPNVSENPQKGGETETKDNTPKGTKEPESTPNVPENLTKSTAKDKSSSSGKTTKKEPNIGTKAEEVPKVEPKKEGEPDAPKITKSEKIPLGEQAGGSKEDGTGHPEGEETTGKEKEKTESKVPIKKKSVEDFTKKQEVKDKLKQSISDRLGRLSNRKDLISDEEKPDVIKDLVGLVVDAAKLGEIKLEEGIEYLIKQVPNLKKFINENKNEILAKSKEQKPKVGVSQAAMEQTAAELGINAPEPGKGTTIEESIQKGRDLIAKGSDPDKVIADFNKDKKIGEDEMAVIRARNEQLVKAVHQAGDDFGDNSEQYKQALKDVTDFQKAKKPMDTAWANIGTGMQGENEIDASTVTGLRIAAKEQRNGKDLTPRQEEEAKKLAGRVKALEEENTKLVNRINEEFNKGFDKALQTKVDKVLKSEKRAGRIEEKRAELAALDNLFRKQMAQAGSFPNPEAAITAAKIIYKHVEIGALKLADAIDTFYNDHKDVMGDVTKDDLRQAVNDYTDEQLGNAKKSDLNTRFVDKKDNKFDISDARDIWNYAKKNYLDNGYNNRDMLKGVSQDLGITPIQVREAIASPKAVREITDEQYRIQNKRNAAVREAKAWVKAANTPRGVKFYSGIPGFFFGLKVYGHGTVGGQTHAGMNLFMPSQWKMYFPFFLKQFRNAYGNIAEYEKHMEDLTFRDNYITAKKAGLANDPNLIYDDYQGLAKYLPKFLKKLSTAGDRGFNTLKEYRQDMFDYYFDKAPATTKADPEYVKGLAKMINHATGTSKVAFPKDLNVVFFAPRLEASRWARLAEPVKAGVTLTKVSFDRALSVFGKQADWTTTSEGERANAKIVALRSAEVVGTYMTCLAVNQALLSATGSKRNINAPFAGLIGGHNDPLASDWLKFKVGDKNIDLTGGMVSTVDFLGKLIKLAIDQKRGKVLPKDETLAKTVFSYGRGKLSPVASTTLDWYLGQTYNKDILPPFKDKPTKGHEKLSWGKYLGEQQTPIPVAEAVQDVFRSMKEQGIKKSVTRELAEGFILFSLTGGTGMKITPKSKTEKK